MNFFLKVRSFLCFRGFPGGSNREEALPPLPLLRGGPRKEPGFIPLNAPSGGGVTKISLKT